jgi:hydrogenase maturation protease
MKTEKNILILGIGNILWADEGFGVRAVERLDRQYCFPANVTLMDGGTQGLYLVQYVQQADVLVVFDAIDYGLPPGTMKIIHDEDVPRFMGVKKMSLHQTGFQEVLSSAELLGNYPEHLLLVGVQPVELEDYGGSLRPAVKDCIDPAIAIVLDYLRDFGISAKPRSDNSTEPQQLSSSPLGMDIYEQQRPSEQEACRIGDDRFLAERQGSRD